MKHVLITLTSMLLLLSCTKDPVTPPTGPITISDTTINNLSYGEDGANKLDLHLPANRTKETKLIILIHGGGWSAGAKEDLSFFANRLKQKQFAVANINYRLSTPKNPDNYKMQLDDIARVISFLRSHTNTYTYGTGSIYLAGHSAGAHLALSYSYTRNADKNIKAVAGLASPTNLYSLSYYNASIADPLIIPYLGGEREKMKQRYQDCSPFYQVNANSVPTILFSGELDPITPVSQSEELIGALNKVSVPNKLQRYALAFHDWWATPIYFDDTIKEMSAWFKKY